MQIEHWFYIAFLGQIFTISLYFPLRKKKGVQKVIEDFPPSTHPKLYVESPEFYLRVMESYIWKNYAIAAIGVIFLFSFALYLDADWYKDIVTVYFFLQYIAHVQLEFSQTKHLKKMQGNTHGAIRKANLQPRRLLTVVAPSLLISAATVYVAFVLYQLYLYYFMSGGSEVLISLAIMTLGNLFFAAATVYTLRKKKLDPYSRQSDYMQALSLSISALWSISIAATVFLALISTIEVLEMDAWEPTLLCIYFSLIAVLGLGAQRNDYVDYDVYKKNPVPAQH